MKNNHVANQEAKDCLAKNDIDAESTSGDT